MRFQFRFHEIEACYLSSKALSVMDVSYFPKFFYWDDVGPYLAYRLSQ